MLYCKNLLKPVSLFFRHTVLLDVWYPLKKCEVKPKVVRCVIFRNSVLDLTVAEKKIRVGMILTQNMKKT